MTDTITPHRTHPAPSLPPLAELRWHADARAAINVHRNVLLIGPPGSGKTTFAEHEAWARTGKAPLRLQGTPRTDSHHVWGRTSLRNGSTAFDENVLHRALAEERVLVVEDFGLVPHDIRAHFLAMRGDLPVTNPETGETLHIPPGFRLIATSNDERVGCRRTGGIARALLDDFLVVQADEPGREEALAMAQTRLADLDRDLVERAFDLWRDAFDLHGGGQQEGKIRPSVRSVEHLARLLDSGVTTRRAMSMAVVGKFVIDADAHEAAVNYLAMMSYDDDQEDENEA